jgi:hypothetical protein
MAVARRLKDLPPVFDQHDRPAATMAYLTLAERPEASGGDSTMWKGHTDVLFAASRLLRGEPVGKVLLAASREVSAIWYDNAPGRTHGVFAVSTDGRSTITMRVEGPGGVILGVQGRRLSSEVVQTK